jgi:hypothetical protein
MILLPPEVRLLIYQFAFAQSTSVALAHLARANISLLRTCRLVHQEGAPIFYGLNDFSISAHDGEALDRLHRCLGRYTNLIRHLTINVDLAGATFVDRVWNLSKAQAELVPACAKLLHTFRDLQSLSVNIAVPHRCLQHHSQIAEIMCQTYREDCLLLCTTTRDQLRRLGKVNAAVTAQQSSEVSTTSFSLRPNVWKAYTDSRGTKWQLWIENEGPATLSDETK